MYRHFKMMIRTFFIVALTMSGVFTAPQDDGAAFQEFVAGNRQFTAAVYRELAKKETGNFIMSPLSAEVVLALTAEGARGETLKEMVTGLSLPSTHENTQKALKYFLPKLKPTDNLVPYIGAKPIDASLKTANKIYVANDAKLEAEFEQVSREIYRAGVENVNFGDNVAAANKINQWVEGETNNRIQNLIDPNSIDGLTKLVLVNALYFKAPWVNPFEEYATQKKKFYTTKTDSNEVDMMHQTDYFNYYENKDLNAKFLELPYAGTDVTMVICLPNEIDGLSAIEQNLDQVLKPQPFSRERVEVQLPKFKIETSIGFIPILKTLGIKHLFDSSANLTGLSSNFKDLYVSEVIQKAFIEVNEAGTEAAAATAVKAETLSIKNSRPILQYFHATKPFVYTIRMRKVDLFIGKVSNLKSSNSVYPVNSAIYQKGQIKDSTKFSPHPDKIYFPGPFSGSYPGEEN